MSVESRDKFLYKGGRCWVNIHYFDFEIIVNNCNSDTYIRIFENHFGFVPVKHRWIDAFSKNVNI